MRFFSYLCCMEKMLYLVRGLPGSGKSTFSKTLGGIHIEADQYFVDIEGNYNFDGSKIKLAHEYCRAQTGAWMKTDGLQVNVDKIVVSNTFTQEWEMEPYYELAKKYGYKVFSIIVENRHEGINEHGVPEEKIEQMKNRFEIKL
jgi:energy-coupling factor transporter ATP-binding protein EcfA2